MLQIQHLQLLNNLLICEMMRPRHRPRIALHVQGDDFAVQGVCQYPVNPVCLHFQEHGLAVALGQLFFAGEFGRCADGDNSSRPGIDLVAASDAVQVDVGIPLAGEVADVDAAGWFGGGGVGWGGHGAFLVGKVKRARQPGEEVLVMG